MDLNARVDVNCGRKDGRMENCTPTSHLATAGATIMKYMQTFTINFTSFNPIALRKAKIASNFGLAVCNRVNRYG